MEFFKKDNTQYNIDYKPVLNAPNVTTGVGNAAHNTLALVWNGTLGAIGNLGKSINNYFAGGYKEQSNIPDPVYAFIEATNDMYRYHKETPAKQQLVDLGNAATDLRNYEIVPSLVIAHMLSTPSLLPTSSSSIPSLDDIFSTSISTRGAAEKYAEMTKYTNGYFNANNFIGANNVGFDLISTIEKTVVDVTTTAAGKLNATQFTKKLSNLSSVMPKGYKGVVQIYLKEGQYSAEQIGGLRQKLNDYIADYNLQNVSVNIDTIKK